MTIPNIGTNSLVDQTQLNQIIDTVNGISSKFANTISPIYSKSSTTGQQVNSYMGTFAIATNLVKDKIKGSGIAKTIASKTVTVSFGKTFQSIPLIFPSVYLNVSTPGVHLPGMIVSSATTSTCTIVLNLYSDVATSADIDFELSIMAVGLTQL